MEISHDPSHGACSASGCRSGGLGHLPVLGSVLVTPVVEELAFRGYLTVPTMAADFKSVPQGTFSWPSFLVSSSLFGMLHDRWIAGIMAGVFYALALYGRRNLSDAVLAHVCHKCPDYGRMFWRRGTGHCGAEAFSPSRKLPVQQG